MQETNKNYKTGSFEEHEQIFVRNNLHLTNKEIGRELNRSESSITNFLYKEQLKRNEHNLEQIRLRIGANQRGENNPNWKDGRSENNYFYRERARLRNPEKHIARNKVYYAIKSGKLKRLPCEICGDPKSEAHHHKGYDLPLDVQWLCRQHHIELENQKKVS